MSTSKPLTPHQAGALVAYNARVGDVAGEKIARRNLAEAKIADAIERALAVAPPLTPTQVKHLSRLLRGGAR